MKSDTVPLSHIGFSQCLISSQGAKKKHFVNKRNESGFRPLLCTYRLNLTRRTSWGWWDERDDTALQTQDSKFKPWRLEADLANSRSRRITTILSFTSGWRRNIFVSFKPPRPGNEPRTPAWKAAMLTTTPGSPPISWIPSVKDKPWTSARQVVAVTATGLPAILTL